MNCRDNDQIGLVHLCDGGFRHNTEATVAQPRLPVRTDEMGLEQGFFPYFQEGIIGHVEHFKGGFQITQARIAFRHKYRYVFHKYYFLDIPTNLPVSRQERESVPMLLNQSFSLIHSS
jgi:hypothetical protein